MIRTSKGEECASYDDYLLSAHWLWFRWRIITSVLAHCVDCGATAGLHVHHLTYERIGNELDEDVTVLCGRCHMKRHGKRRPGTAIALGDGLAEAFSVLDEKAKAAS